MRIVSPLLALRNLMRNRRRTLLSALIIGIGLAALMITDGLMEGMIRGMIRGATRTYLGEGVVALEGYSDTLEVTSTIADLPATERRLRESPGIRAFAPRIKTFAMVSSAENARGILLHGIDPAREPEVTLVMDAVVRGERLSADGPRGQILIGEKLAKKLGAEIGHRLVVTASQAGTGELAQQLFRVRGIFRFGTRELDEGAAFVPIQEARGLLNLAGRAHEVVLRLSDPGPTAEVSHPLWKGLSVSGDLARSWKALSPQITAAIGMSDLSVAIIAVILAGLVALGIINSLFMSVYERMYEFGVLRGIGTRRAGVVRMVLAEAAWLAVLACGFGLLLGTAVNGALLHWGIDYSSMEFAGVSFQEPIRSVFRWRQYWVFPLWVTGLTLAAGLYPAIHAARIPPAVALRKRT